MEGQKSALFEQRHQSLDSQISVLKSRKAQYLELVSGLQAQLLAVEGQTSLIAPGNGGDGEIVRARVSRRCRRCWP